MKSNPSGKVLAPKPYTFVPFARRIERYAIASDTVPGHQRLDLADRYTGRLIYRLETLTPVFVGTGSYALGWEAGFPHEEVIRPFYRVNGIPAVPGSSLKGVARSIVEAVSPSCITASRVHGDRLPPGVELAHGRGTHCTPTKACPACAIFGRMSRLGKARFGDALLVERGSLDLFRLPSLFAPRAGSLPGVYLGRDGKFRGRKFYYHSRPAEDERQPPVEVIPKGRRVQGQIDFENLSPAEFGLLCFAIGLDGSIALKLGGGKPLGLGSLRVVRAELTMLQADHFLESEGREQVFKDQQAVADFVGRAIDAALETELLLKPQAQALIRVLTFNDKRAAPDGAY